MKILRYLLPLIILALGGLVSFVFFATKSEPQQREFPYRMPEVQGIQLKPEEFQVTLKTQGVVQARTQINLVAEIRGRVIEVAPNFREGGFFEQGELLLRIDPVDYESDLVIAQAALAQAELNLKQEQARYEQAKRDWDRLSSDSEPNPLVLREPQIKQARANIASAEARVRTAERNLERTEIRAPFAGRVLTKNVDVGRYVSPGNPLANIYAVDFAEVRLPLTSKQVAFLRMQEVYRGESPELNDGPEVVAKYKVGNREHEWVGRIVRAEGAVDANSRQLFVYAQFDNPYGRSERGKPPLKVGTFVTANIQGVLLKDVYVIPRRLLNETKFVIVADEENYLHRRYINIIWSEDEYIIARNGFEPGDRLCLTDVPYSLEGLEVNMTEVAEIPSEEKEEKVKETQVVRRPSSPAQAAGGNPMIQGMLNAIPEDKKLPDELMKRLEQAMASGDRQQIRPVMQEIRKWGEENGVNFPSPRRP